IGIEDTLRSDTIFLFMRTNVCAPCLKELAWWNENSKKLIDSRVSLILIEKYRPRFNAFISSHNIAIKTYQDHNDTALKNDLIPSTPIKIYFNDLSKIEAIDYMGGYGNFKSFLKEMRD